MKCNGGLNLKAKEYMIEYFVSHSFLDFCAEHNSCMGLSNDVPTARAIINFQSRKWVCTGSVSRGSINLSAELCECVAPGLYRGPAYDDDSISYQGLHFTCRYYMTLRWDEPIEFVFTGREIRVKISTPHEKNLYKAMR